MKASPRLRHLRSLPALTLTAACALALAACSSSSSGGGTGGSPGTGTGGSKTPGSGGSNTGSGGSNTGSGGSNTGSGGTVGSGGAIGSGGSNPTGTGGANTGSGGSAPGSGGANGGHGGASTGSGGSAPTGTGGAGGSANAGAACPQNAIFCTGFEESSGPPAGTTIWTDSGKPFDQLMWLDKSAPFAGAQSLEVLSSGISGYDYRMLSVPVPATFWVRLYVKSDQDLGQAEHNAFFQAMTDPNHNNSANTLEVSEQYCQLVLNDHDQTYPQGVACGSGGTPLAKNVWHCMETLFDGTNGTVQVYADGAKIIDAENWSYGIATFNTFEFGLAEYHGPARNTWYDDLAIAPTRIGCE
jgi:hypothetical protein